MVIRFQKVLLVLFSVIGSRHVARFFLWGGGGGGAFGERSVPTRPKLWQGSGGAAPWRGLGGRSPPENF